MQTTNEWLPYIEVLFLLSFIGGWLAVEWQGKRLDKKLEREREAARAAAQKVQPSQTDAPQN